MFVVRKGYICSATSHSKNFELCRGKTAKQTKIIANDGTISILHLCSNVSFIV